MLGGLLFPDKAAPALVPQQRTPIPLADMAASAGAGVARGTAETAMLPVTLKRLGEAAVDGTLRGVENAGRSLLGYPTVSAEDFAKRGDAARAGFGNVLDRNVNARQDAAREAMDNTLYAPRTTAGAYARTVGEFLPSMAMGGPIVGGLRGAAGRFAGDVLAPALVSETAGQMTQGTALEPWARFAGGLAGNVGVSAGRARFGTPEGVAGAAARGVTPDQFQQARELLTRGRDVGVPLSGPEALSQVTNGGTRLPQLMRFVEGSADGGSRTAPFFAQRPQQVDRATQALLDSVGVRSADPYSLGPQTAETANAVLRSLEQQRTAATAPLYAAANGQRVDAGAVRGIIDQLDHTARADTSGLLAGTIGDVRRSLVERPAQPATATTPAVPEIPVTDVENLNRIRKHYTEHTSPRVPGQSSATKEQNHPVNTAISQVADLINQVPAQAAANAEFTRLSREIVDPAMRGPLGNIARAGDTKTVQNALLPPPGEALSGGHGQLANATMALLAREAAPGATAGPVLPTTVPSLVRNTLENAYDQARAAPLGGSNQAVGAKTAKALAGNPQQRANLSAVLEALPGGQALANRANNLLDVLFASGRRLGEGSPTEFNRMLRDDLSELPVIRGGVRSLLTGIPRILHDGASRAMLGRNTGALADMFLAPNSVDLIQQATQNSASRLPIWAAAAARQAAQTPTEILRTQ